MYDKVADDYDEEEEERGRMRMRTMMLKIIMLRMMRYRKMIRWRVMNVAEYQLEDDYVGEDEEAEEDKENEIEDIDLKERKNILRKRIDLKIAHIFCTSLYNRNLYGNNIDLVSHCKWGFTYFSCMRGRQNSIVICNCRIVPAM